MKISKRKIFVFFIFVIFILIETISFASYIEAKSGEEERRNNIEIMINEEASLKEEENETLNLINEYREKNGLTKLKPISKLQNMAKLKAEDIVKNEYFSHTSENLGTPFEMLKENGVEYKFAGENLAGSVSPKKAVEAWINSPTHKDNILDKDFEYTGIYVTDSPVYRKNICTSIYRNLKNSLTY